jgi:hypothetical protein
VLGGGEGQCVTSRWGRGKWSACEGAHSDKHPKAQSLRDVPPTLLPGVNVHGMRSQPLTTPTVW